LIVGFLSSFVIFHEWIGKEHIIRRSVDDMGGS